MFAFNIRYFRITQLTKLTGHMIWTYPNKLLNQKKKVGQNSKSICLWAEELITVLRITGIKFCKDSPRVCLNLLGQL